MAEAPQVGDDRDALIHAISAASMALDEVVCTAGETFIFPDWAAIQHLDKAVQLIASASVARQLGIHPFGVLFSAACEIGVAIESNRQANARSRQASGGRPGAARLRQLTHHHTHLGAAALGRLLREESGISMPEADVRKVVRSVRTLPKLP